MELSDIRNTIFTWAKGTYLSMYPFDCPTDCIEAV